MKNEVLLVDTGVATLPENCFGEKRISILKNSIYYFLGSVFIICQGNCYRLVVMSNGRLLVDESYKSAKGCKIAFSRIYRNKVWKEGVKPRWSPFFSMDDRPVGMDFPKKKRLTH